MKKISVTMNIKKTWGENDCPRCGKGVGVRGVQPYRGMEGWRKSRLGRSLWHIKCYKHTLDELGDQLDREFRKFMPDFMIKKRKSKRRK